MKPLGRCDALPMLGKRYGRLCVLRISDRPYSVVCLCDCGKEHIVRKYGLLNGKHKSCGCFQKERAAQGCRARKGIPNNADSPLRYAWRNYKYNAGHRKMLFELTKEQFHVLAQQPCAYCGQAPTRANHHGSDIHSIYVGNGIDRIDNKKGYVLENCTPCCRRCNAAKGTMPVDDFIQMCLAVTKKQKVIFCSKD